MKKEAENFLKSKGYTLSAIHCYDMNLTNGNINLVELLTEFAESQAPNKGMISDGEVFSKAIKKSIEYIEIHEDGNTYDFRSGFESCAEWMKSKLSNTDTSEEELKEICKCSDEELCGKCMEDKGWIIHECQIVRNPDKTN